MDYMRSYAAADGGTARSASEARALVDKLQSGGWIDRQTRVVFVDLLLYNPSIGCFGVMRIHLEHLASGGIIPAYSFGFIRPQYHQIATATDVIAIILQALTCRRRGPDAVVGEAGGADEDLGGESRADRSSRARHEADGRRRRGGRGGRRLRKGRLAARRRRRSTARVI